MTYDPRTKRPTIGVLAGWQYYWTPTPQSYLAPIYRGIRLAAQEFDCNLLLGCGMGPSHGDWAFRPAWSTVSEETDFVPIGPWNTDGLVVVSPLQSETQSRYIAEVIASHHPVMFVGTGESGPTIAADNAGGITQALRHLVDHGHRRIAFIAGSPEDMEGDTGDRMRAFQEGVKAFGLSDDKRLMAFGRHVIEGGKIAMRQILASGVPFSAVLASNDQSANGAMQALRAAGRSIPGDVAIIGFDDQLESVVQQPTLTSVHNPLFQMGYQSVDSLLNQRMDGVPSESVRVPARLVIRESCGCGPNAMLATMLTETAAQADTDPTQTLLYVTNRMVASVLAGTQGLAGDETEVLCRRLLESFVASVQDDDFAALRQTLDSVLMRAAEASDDAHGWQTALSILRNDLPLLVEISTDSATLTRAYAFVDRARVVVSAAMRKQYRQFMVDQHWIGDRIAEITARLLTALDEDQVYDILASSLPEVGIHTAWVGLFEPEGDDDVAWCQWRAITAPQQPVTRIRSREFPPRAWVREEEPLSLALLPLVGLRGGAGVVALDAVHLDSLGGIVQQMGASLNMAQLYRDATEGRRLAEEADQMKSRFLSTVSHELRTPLNLIVGTSGILLQESGGQLPEQIQQDAESIHHNARHLGRLIGDVLDLASSDAGQLRLSYDFVDLGLTLQQTAEIGRQLAVEKGLNWRDDLPESGPWVWGDLTRLHQVALNLISNAVKFTNSGEVGISVKVESQSVTVNVFDTGLGLPLSEQEGIFDEFQRSERSVTQGYGGIGLGLAICKRLVSMHEGMIGVRSSGEEGTGSTFFFSLPIVPAPTAVLPQVAAPSSQPSPAHKQQILVLSSSTAGEGRLQQHLKQRGFLVQAIAIEDSVTWLSQLLTEPYNAVVLDISQSSKNGWVALKTLKNNPVTRDIPTLLYAASSDNDAILELDYLTKPIEVTELTRALDQQWLTATVPADQVRTILVVDDDSLTRELHGRIIRSHSSSNRVLSAGNGVEALEILKKTHVDLVILDLIMPGLDGFGVLEAMQEDAKHRSIPVIVVTGQVLSEQEMERLNRGVTTVMSKGVFDFDETIAHLDAALAREHRLSDETQRTVRKAMAYIHEHYWEPISRHNLAHYVGMSDDYLTFCFRQELGMTPIAYLNRYRIVQAKNLLATTDRSVTDIALDVGFTNSAYFSRMFKREVGISPTVFRQRQET